MRLTENQALLMFLTLYDSISIVGGPPFRFNSEQRRALVNEILKQQDNDQFLEFVKEKGEEEKEGTS